MIDFRLKKIGTQPFTFPSRTGTDIYFLSQKRNSMKQLFLLLLLVGALGLQAQDNLPVGEPTDGKSPFLQLSPKASTLLNRFSLSATVGTPSFAFSELNSLNLKKITQVNLAAVNLSYKMNKRFSFGISGLNNLGNYISGYYDAEGKLVTFEHDDDDDDYEDEEEDDMDDDDDEDCDDDEIGNLMGNVTVKLSDKFPIFVQAAGGYAFGQKVPTYSAMIGYNQKLFAGFGILAGIRYSDVIRQKPAGATGLSPSNGLKAELGLSWNF